MLVSLLIPFLWFPALAQAEVNAGFVEGLWYAHEPVFADIPTRIYVALRNNTQSDLSGTIRFTDNGTRIGSSDVRALSGRLVEAWIDWKPSYGEHTLTVTLTGAQLHAVGETPTAIEDADIVISETITIDYDTDGDGIGNETDPDDDNDTVSDVDEKNRGSNPLVSNPIPREESQEEKSTQREDDSKNISSDNTETEKTQSTASRKGLEQYVGDGMVGNLFTNVTEKVDRAKQSLDTHRTLRNATLSAPPVVLSSSTPGASAESATITRSKLPSDESLLKSFVSGVRSLFQNIWTFILFILSNALAHPALIQLLILFGILYIFYRLIRRVGRRPID